jgi:cell division protein FtsB
MAARNGNVAYDLSRYEPLRKMRQPARRPAAPAYTPPPPKKPELVRPKPKTAEQAWEDLLARFKRTVKIITVSALLFGMFGSLVYERARLVELTRQETVLTEALKEAQSRNVSLTAQFNSLISIDNVEKFAKDELGMVKRQRYQTKYFVVEGDDKVILANGEAVCDDSGE